MLSFFLKYVQFALMGSLLWVCFRSGSLFAEPDFDHRRNVIPGNRASGMGGAFTAIADDSTAAFYNPAGLVFVDGSELSISATTILVSKVEYKNIELLGNEDFVEESVTIFPSFVGSSFNTGNFGYGWSIVTLDAQNINQKDSFTNLSTDSSQLDNYNRTNQEANQLILSGVSVALKLGKNFALGLSGYYYSRTVAATNHQVVELTDGSFLVSDLHYTVLNEGGVAIAGLIYRGDTHAFGLRYYYPISTNDSSSFITDTATSVVSSGAAGFVSNSEERSGFEELSPTTISLGYGWKPSKSFTFSMDALYHSAAERGIGGFEAYDLDPAFDISLGAEMKFSTLSFRAGVFTNNSQSKEVLDGGLNQAAKIDYYGGTFGFGIFDKVKEAGFTIVEQFGTGKAQKIADTTDIQDVVGRSSTYQINGVYRF